jgi:hypothetical protein
MALSIVPIPGICFSGHQNKSTHILIIKVDSPILQLLKLLTPCASTVQGLTPVPAAIRSASPKPNNERPNTKEHMVTSLGRKFWAFVELQNKVGTVLTDKKDSLKSISFKDPAFKVQH